MDYAATGPFGPRRAPANEGRIPPEGHHATCFWQRSTCPTLMPCQEHRGIWCGRFHRRGIAGLAGIRNDRVDAAVAVIRSLHYRLQHVTTCPPPFDGWQGIEPPAPEDRSQELREVDRHLEDRVREGTGR